MKTHGIAFIWMVLAFSFITVVQSPAQTYSTGVNFNAEDGALPESPLIEGLDGTLYGTTFNGGGIEAYCLYQWGCGSIYTPVGSSFANVLHAFCTQGYCPDGSLPTSGLVQATNGNLYGTTQGGSTYQSPCGEYGCGTVFEFVFGNVGVTTLHTFNNTDGGVPTTGLVQARNGKLYGTTTQGGTNGNYGTLFEITLSGTLTTVYNFCALANCADGWLPSGPLVQGSDGNLYGETQEGGTITNGGTIFKVNSQGTLTTLYSFCAKSKCADGGGPMGGLIQAADGNFYGTTVGGGAYGWGTIFRITPAGKLTTLHSFCSQTNCTDGKDPYTGVIQATDGNLYGTTYDGGANDFGTIFELSAKGKFTTLYSFCSQYACPDGGYPMAGLLEDTGGLLQGTASAGGLYYFGTTYSLSVGLSAFVRATPNIGRVGTAVILTGPVFYATAVKFNGIPAAFSFVSDSEISTTVPSGATTGKISVVTTFGTIKSALPFKVIP